MVTEPSTQGVSVDAERVRGGLLRRVASQQRAELGHRVLAEPAQDGVGVRWQGQQVP